MNGELLVSQSSEWLAILFSILVKGIVILATAAPLTAVLRSASARVRHIVWCAAFCGLLALPLFTEWLQPLDVPILSSGFFSSELVTHRIAQNAVKELPGQASIEPPSYSGSQGNQSAETNLVEERRLVPGFLWPLLILLVWLTGLLLILGRFAGGVIIVRRRAANATELTDAAWSELKSDLGQQLRLRRHVRILRSDESLMPMICMGISPLVLMPKEADHWPADRRRAVLLHELIHIKRRDLLMQTLAQVACALYWFNPLVWWAAKRLRIEQELACDERVVASGMNGPVYAEHLLAIARKFQTDGWAGATTAMARPSQLQERLCAILKPAGKRGGSVTSIVVSMAIMIAVLVLTAATRLVTAEGQRGANVSSVVDGIMKIRQEAEARLSVDRKLAETDSIEAPVSEDNPAFRTPSPSPTPIDQSADQFATPKDSSSQTAEQIFDDFTSEERARLANNGIGPAYLEEMQEAGYRQLSVEQLIALFSNGVRAKYVAGLGAVGYARLSTSDLLSLKTNGITPEVIRSFQAVKHADFEATNYGSLVSNGVTPLYVRSLNDAGYDYLTANKIVAMRLAGITSDFIREARIRSNTDLSANELIELKRREKQ